MFDYHTIPKMELDSTCAHMGPQVVSYLGLASNILQQTACFLLCLSSLNFKPTKAVVTKSILASVASSTVMVHFSTVCINFSHSFKFNSVIISLKDLLLLSGNGNVSSGAISAAEAQLPIPKQSRRLERML